MENLKPLTSGEENLMQIIWNSNASYLKDIMLAYPEPKPHQNTISTFLKNLVEKNYLSPSKEGRIHRYEVSVSRDNYRNVLVKNLIENFYNSSPNNLLQDLIENGLIIASVPSEEKDKKKKKKKRSK